MANENWARIPALAMIEDTVTIVATEDAAIVDVTRTITTYGFIYDDDDGLPLSYPGERYRHA